MRSRLRHCAIRGQISAYPGVFGLCPWHVLDTLNDYSPEIGLPVHEVKKFTDAAVSHHSVEPQRLTLAVKDKAGTVGLDRIGFIPAYCILAEGRGVDEHSLTSAST